MNESRAEHLEWAKERALECVDRGEPGKAIKSLISDLMKHPDTKNHNAILPLSVLSLKFPLPIGEVRRAIEGIS